MAFPVIMPRQGQSVETCIITEIYKSVGDKVEKGELIFAYETDKASFEEEAPESGTILAAFFKTGDEVPVLTNVMVIGQSGESFKEFIPGSKEPQDSPEESPQKDVPIKEEKSETTIEYNTKTTKLSGQQFISPRAKNLADKKGIDISKLKGSGPDGRIVERDVLHALESVRRLTPLAGKKSAEQKLTSPVTGTGLAGTVTSRDLMKKDTASSDDFEIVPLSNIRKIIARSMHQSLQNSAQLTHHLSADASKLLSLRQEIKGKMNEGTIENITINDLVCLAVIRILIKYPNVNAHFTEDSLKKFRRVHLGMAVDTERGLMVPAVRSADLLSIKELSTKMKSLADACRKGSVDPDLLLPEAATFTVSNLGNYGVEMFTPIINLPQVAILGVNTIVPRPKDLGDGKYGFVPYIGLSLTYDHRAVDGGEATRFLRDIALEIENLEIEI